MGAEIWVLAKDLQEESKRGSWVRSWLQDCGENNHGRIIFKYLNNLPPDK